MGVRVVIAAYNEEGSIRKVLADLRKHGYRDVIVVDDGSEDRTTELAEAGGAVVARHIINRGQGAALQTGIAYALRKKADVVVTFDADGQHHAKDIKRLVKPVVEGKADVALGSRFLRKTHNASWGRALILKGGALSFRILYGIRLTDSHNGFRALSRKAAQKIKLKSDGMEHASEIVQQIADHKLRYVEVPVTITYTDYSKGKGQGNGAALRIMSKMLLDKLKR